MIDINGKFYKIDMDAVMKWVTETPSSEKNINTITTLTYPMSDETTDIVEKEISETKSTLNETMNNVRYDFVRILINTLLVTFTNDMGQMIPIQLSQMPFAQKMAFNTLIAKNIIKEVTDINND